MDAVPTVKVGALGVVPIDPEVIAVFPELSSTVQPHAQEIRLYRGDDLDITVQLQNDGDPPDPVSLVNAVVRWAAKQGYGNLSSAIRSQTILGNESALIYKRSHVPSEVEIVDPSRGRAIVHLTRDDTMDLPSVPAIWDLEVTRPIGDYALPADARIQLTAGSDVAIAIGFDWIALGVRRGDIIETAGRRVLVRQVTSTMHARLDFFDWTGGYYPIVIRKGRSKTVAAGRFVVMGDVVR